MRQKMDERGCDRNVSIFALLLKHIAVEAKKKIDRKSTVQTMFQKLRHYTFNISTVDTHPMLRAKSIVSNAGALNQSFAGNKLNLDAFAKVNV